MDSIVNAIESNTLKCSIDLRTSVNLATCLKCSYDHWLNLHVAVLHGYSICTLIVYLLTVFIRNSYYQSQDQYLMWFFF